MKIIFAGFLSLAISNAAIATQLKSNDILNLKTGDSEAQAKSILSSEGYSVTGTLDYQEQPGVPSHTGEIEFHKQDSTIRVKFSPVSGRVMMIMREDTLTNPVLAKNLSDSFISKYGSPTGNFDGGQRLEWRYDTKGAPVTNMYCKFLTNISVAEAQRCSVSVFSNIFGNPATKFAVTIWDYRVQLDDIKKQDKINQDLTKQSLQKANQQPSPKL